MADDNMSASSSMFENGAKTADLRLLEDFPSFDEAALYQEQWEHKQCCYHVPPPTATPLVKPKNVYQALEHLRWREALFSEFKSFLDNKAFHVTDWPRDDPGAIIVQLMPLLSTKERADLQEALCKARFVANGAKLVGAPGTPETYSSTPSREAFRIFFMRWWLLSSR